MKPAKISMTSALLGLMIFSAFAAGSAAEPARAALQPAPPAANAAGLPPEPCPFPPGCNEAASAAPALAPAAASDSPALPATPSCGAKSLTSSFDYPTCGQCSGDGCRGQYVGTICGLDQFGQLMVCQDQLVGCYPNPYPETIFCRCTSDIVP